MFDTYVECEQQITKFYMTNPSLSSKLKSIDFDKYVLAPKYPDILEKIKQISLELASIMELQHKLMIQFKSKEFNDLIIEEIRV